MRDIPMTDARYELTSLPEKLSSAHEAVSVSRRGKPVLAILPWEEYETIVETLEILGDGAMMAALRKGIREGKEDKGIAWETAKKRLGR